jgi:hypothetical protein
MRYLRVSVPPFPIGATVSESSSIHNGSRRRSTASLKYIVTHKRPPLGSVLWGTTSLTDDHDAVGFVVPD